MSGWLAPRIRFDLSWPIQFKAFNNPIEQINKYWRKLYSCAGMQQHENWNGWVTYHLVAGLQSLVITWAINHFLRRAKSDSVHLFASPFSFAISGRSRLGFCGYGPGSIILMDFCNCLTCGNIHDIGRSTVPVWRYEAHRRGTVCHCPANLQSDGEEILRIKERWRTTFAIYHAIVPNPITFPNTPSPCEILTLSSKC